MRAFVCVTLAASLVMAGCAAPNTPGRGSGESYTPVIDMQGLDSSRYQADLDSCRQYTRTINPVGEAIAGAIIGGLVGAAVGASVGSGTRWQGGLTRNTAAYGASYGSLQAGGRGVVKQETIMANCMAGRGYRTLDATVPVNYMAPSPYATVPAVAGGQQLPGMVPMTYAVITPQPAAERQESGKDEYTAQRMAKDQQCSAQPKTKLTGKGPGFETYSVACDSGDVWAMRCEFGNCRVLQ